MSWPVITRVNIGDDAALLRRIDVSITSFDNPMICSNKKHYNMKYHVILGRFKWLINVSPSLEGIRYLRSVYLLSFVCFFLLLLLFLYSLEKQFG